MHWKQGPLRATKFFGNVQVGCGTKRGAEIAAQSFRKLIERDNNPKCTVVLKLDFEIAFNSLNRETMLNHVYSNAANFIITPIAHMVNLVTFFTEALS